MHLLIGKEEIISLDLIGMQITPKSNVVVLEESPCPQESSRTNLQVLVFVLVQVLDLKFLKTVKEFALCKQSFM